jgi:hypothetical protein
MLRRSQHDPSRSGFTDFFLEAEEHDMDFADPNCIKISPHSFWKWCWTSETSDVFNGSSTPFLLISYRLLGIAKERSEICSLYPNHLIDSIYREGSGLSHCFDRSVILIYHLFGSRMNQTLNFNFAVAFAIS